jgi:hypothetical protein
VSADGYVSPVIPTAKRDLGFLEKVRKKVKVRKKDRRDQRQR